MKMIEGVPARSPLGRALASRQKAFDVRRLAEKQKQVADSWQAAARSSGGEFVDENGVDYILSDTAAPGRKVQNCSECSGPVDVSAIGRGQDYGCPHCGAGQTRQVSDDNLDGGNLDDSDAMDDGALPSDGHSDAAALESLDATTGRVKKDLPSRAPDGSPFTLRDIETVLTVSERRAMKSVLDQILARRRGVEPPL